MGSKPTHYWKQGHEDACIAQRDGAKCGLTRSEHHLTTGECPWHAHPSQPGPVHVPPSAAQLGRGVLQGDDVRPGNAVQVEKAATESGHEPEIAAPHADEGSGRPKYAAAQEAKFVHADDLNDKRAKKGK